MNLNINYINHNLGYKTISEAVLSPYGTTFNIDNTINEFNLAIKPLSTLNTLWNEEQFSKTNLPKEIFTLNKAEIEFYSVNDSIRVLDMPIKFPGTEYKIPQELTHLISIIKKIASHEHIINSKINDYFCYLTIDRRIVKSGNTTRKSGIHVDGFQGARLGEKLPVDHSYIIYNNLPTIFYNQAFKVQKEWDKNCHNYFEGFEKQKSKSSEVTYPVNTVLLIDAYTLHEAPMVLEDTHRTFVRLSYTVREFDRLGNAHNHMFEYEWKMFPRDTQIGLICPNNF